MRRWGLGPVLRHHIFALTILLDGEGFLTATVRTGPRAHQRVSVLVAFDHVPKADLDRGFWPSGRSEDAA